MIRKPPPVVTLGESMIRYSPRRFARLEQAHQLEMRVAGAASSVKSSMCLPGCSAKRWVKQPVALVSVRHRAARCRHRSGLSVSDRDQLNLEKSAPAQAGDLNSRACWRQFGEVSAIDGVHHGAIIQVGEEYRRLDDSVQR